MKIIVALDSFPLKYICTELSKLGHDVRGSDDPEQIVDIYLSEDFIHNIDLLITTDGSKWSSVRGKIKKKRITLSDTTPWEEMTTVRKLICATVSKYREENQTELYKKGESNDNA